jgi:hypothetical protein
MRQICRSAIFSKAASLADGSSWLSRNRNKKSSSTFDHSFLTAVIHLAVKLFNF